MAHESFFSYGWFYWADIVKIYGMGSVTFPDGCARDKYKVQGYETLANLVSGSSGQRIWEREPLRAGDLYSRHEQQFCEGRTELRWINSLIENRNVWPVRVGWSREEVLIAGETDTKGASTYIILHSTLPMSSSGIMLRFSLSRCRFTSSLMPPLFRCQYN